MTITERIDDFLKSKKMSRRQAALQAGIPPSSFQSAMQRNGDMSIEMLKRIADVLGVRVSDLTGDWYDDHNMTVGEKLKFARMKAVITPYELSRATNISFETIYDYEENGVYPDINVVKAVCSYLGLNYNLIMSTEKDSFTPSKKVSATASDYEKYNMFINMEDPKRINTWIPDKAQQLLFFFKFLNDSGKDRAIEDLMNLTQIKKYAIGEIGFKED